MIRNLKSLGLAIMAVIGMSAVVASAASADPPTLISDGPVKLAGTDLAKSVLTYNESQKIECHGKYSLGKENETPSGFIANPTTTATAAPTYSSCEGKLGVTNVSYTATMNGCDYVLHLGSTIEMGKWGVTTDIVCPEGKEVEVHGYSSAEHTTSICTFKLPAQTGKAGAFVKNLEGGKVTLGGTVEGLKASRTGVLCGGGNSTESGKLDLDAEISGTNEKEGSTGIEIVDESTGLISDGPVKLAGTDLAKSVLTYNESQKIECHGKYSLGKENETPSGFIANPTTTATAAPTYSSCEGKLGVTNVSYTATMNGCDYVLHLGSTIEMGKWGVTTDIVCPEGKEVEVHGYSSAEHTTSICTFKLPAQTGKAGAFVKNLEGGKVTLGGTVEGLKASRTGVLCGGGNSTESGKLDLDAEISGTNEKEGSTGIEIVDESTGLISDGPVKLAGTDLAKSVLTYNESQKIECHGKYSLGKENETPSGFIANPTTTATAAPTYSSCEGKLGVTNVSYTATMNGCDYVLHLGSTIEMGKWGVTTDIVCPEGKEVEVHGYSSAEHTTSICTFKLPAQTGKAGAFVKNLEGGKVTLGGTVEGLKASRTGVLCGGGNSTESGKLDLDAEISGTNEKEGSTGIEIVD